MRHLLDLLALYLRNWIQRFYERTFLDGDEELDPERTQ